MSKGALDAPPADASLEEMEDYIAENRDVLETELTGGMASGAANVNAKVKVFDAEELASGDVAVSGAGSGIRHRHDQLHVPEPAAALARKHQPT